MRVLFFYIKKSGTNYYETLKGKNLKHTASTVKVHLQTSEESTLFTSIIVTIAVHIHTYQMPPTGRALEYK